MPQLFDVIRTVQLGLFLPIGYLIYRYFVYPAFLSSLNKIPNAHPLAPYTGLWILRARFANRENPTLYEAHQKLGPVVRLGPSEISVNCLDGIRVVYGRNFDKHSFYPNAFSNYR